MQKIELAPGKEISYSLRRSLSRSSIRVRVERGGAVRVSIRPFLPLSVLEQYLQTKKDWLLSQIALMSQFKKPVSRHASRSAYLIHHERARTLIHERINFYNAYYQYAFNSVHIRNQRTRWGSCSKKANLNFNYRLALLPLSLVDYVVVHELCHLKEFNHSERFWSLVAERIPDHKQRRSLLREQEKFLI